MDLDNIELCFSQSEGTPIRGRPLLEALRQRIRKAKRSIVICSCEFTSSEDFILNEQISKQLRDGREVTVYGNSRSQMDAMKLSYGPKGMRVMSWVKPRDMSLFHIKAIVIDDQWLYIGSANMSFNAMRNSAEWGIIGNSPDICKELLEYVSEMEETGLFVEV